VDGWHVPDMVSMCEAAGVEVTVGGDEPRRRWLLCIGHTTVAVRRVVVRMDVEAVERIGPWCGREMDPDLGVLVLLLEGNPPDVDAVRVEQRGLGEVAGRTGIRARDGKCGDARDE